ncbi:MAG: replicative DNA helicase [Chloroflexota bacterium]
MAETTLEKTLPQNIEAEEALLGSLLIDSQAVSRVASFLKPDDFYLDRNRLIYAVYLDLYNRREPSDFVLVCDELERRGQLERVGGASYLTSLVSSVPTAAHAEHYGRLVERCSILRRLINAGAQIAAIGYEEPTDTDSALDRANQILFGVAKRRVSRGFVSLGEALKDYFDQLDYLHQHKGEIIGIPSGFKDLDQLTRGFHRSDLIIIAGRPSVGKTSFALGIASDAAVKHKVPTAVFSLEMSTEQLVQRLLCSEAAVDSQRVRSGFIDEYEWHRISEAFGTLSEAPMFIDDTPGISTMELRIKARQLKAEENLGLIIVDYLQLMQGRGLENRVQEVSEISRGLKALARELDVPLIALSQLSRAVESRQDHRPQLSDLRESGSIEQDADVVIFLHREELYNPNTERKNIADVLLAKHRNGPIGQVPLRFFPAQTRFADLEVYRQPEHR